VTAGFMGGKPQVALDSSHVYLNFADGANLVPLDGAARTRKLKIVQLVTIHQVEEID